MAKRSNRQFFICGFENRPALLLSAIVVVSCILLLFPLAIGAVEAADLPPVAVIGGTMTVSAGETVYLNGSFSSDPGGGTLIFLWTLEEQPRGSIAIITDRTGEHASFVADVPGTYKVRLVVNNGVVTSAPVYATVIAKP